MMKHIGIIKQWLLTAVFVLSCPVAWAQWELDNTGSLVNFVSIKNDSVGEVHSFTSLAGFISASGNVQLAIDLDSVETLIDVRNERLREMLFNTAKFPAAKVTANVDPAILGAVAGGGIVSTDLPVRVQLHGQEKKLTMAVTVVGERNGRIRVFSAHPLMLSAADFGLGAGVNALRDIAGLQAISNAVPVTVQLQFVPVD
jgi:polyisoprenoid-binding protein YceI